MARRKVKAAADETNLILDRIVSANTSRFMGPMTWVFEALSLDTYVNTIIRRVPLIVPAMQTHLLESRSSDQLMRGMGLHKLEFCMMILREVESTYPAATLIRGVFLEAVDRLKAIEDSKLKQEETRSSQLAIPNTTGGSNGRLSSLSDVSLEDSWLNDAIFLDAWGFAGTAPQMGDEQ
jgi:hypothetical protein